MFKTLTESMTSVLIHFRRAFSVAVACSLLFNAGASDLFAAGIPTPAYQPSLQPSYTLLQTEALSARLVRFHQVVSASRQGLQSLLSQNNVAAPKRLSRRHLIPLIAALIGGSLFASNSSNSSTVASPSDTHPVKVYVESRPDVSFTESLDHRLSNDVLPTIHKPSGDDGRTTAVIDGIKSFQFKVRSLETGSIQMPQEQGDAVRTAALNYFVEKDQNGVVRVKSELYLNQKMFRFIMGIADAKVRNTLLAAIATKEGAMNVQMQANPDFFIQLQNELFPNDRPSDFLRGVFDIDNADHRQKIKQMAADLVEAESIGYRAVMYLLYNEKISAKDLDHSYAAAIQKSADGNTAVGLDAQALLKRFKELMQITKKKSGDDWNTALKSNVLSTDTKFNYPKLFDAVNQILDYETKHHLAPKAKGFKRYTFLTVMSRSGNKPAARPATVVAATQTPKLIPIVNEAPITAAVSLPMPLVPSDVSVNPMGQEDEESSHSPSSTTNAVAPHEKVFTASRKMAVSVEIANPDLAPQIQSSGFSKELTLKNILGGLNSLPLTDKKDKRRGYSRDQLKYLQNAFGSVSQVGGDQILLRLLSDIYNRNLEVSQKEFLGGVLLQVLYTRYPSRALTPGDVEQLTLIFKAHKADLHKMLYSLGWHMDNHMLVWDDGVLPAPYVALLLLERYATSLDEKSPVRLHYLEIANDLRSYLEALSEPNPKKGPVTVTFPDLALQGLVNSVITALERPVLTQSIADGILNDLRDGAGNKIYDTRELVPYLAPESSGHVSPILASLLSSIHNDSKIMAHLQTVAGLDNDPEFATAAVITLSHFTAGTSPESLALAEFVYERAYLLRYHRLVSREDSQRLEVAMQTIVGDRLPVARNLLMKFVQFKFPVPINSQQAGTARAPVIKPFEVPSMAAKLIIYNDLLDDMMTYLKARIGSADPLVNDLLDILVKQNISVPLKDIANLSLVIEKHALVELKDEKEGIFKIREDWLSALRNITKSSDQTTKLKRLPSRTSNESPAHFFFHFNIETGKFHSQQTQSASSLLLQDIQGYTFLHLPHISPRTTNNERLLARAS